MFDPKKLERVFVNLILNACEASQGLDAPIMITAKAAGQGFDIRITDGAPGIPECIRDTLFDPFVSYGKPNGTGLGLAIVSKIVQDHSGSVSIEQTSEHGTTVLVRLPVTDRPATKRMESAFT